nr:hypothetical protein [Paludibacter sp.]
MNNDKNIQDKSNSSSPFRGLGGSLGVGGHSYTNVKDLGNLQEAIKEALEIKKNRFGYKHLGENKTLLMVFFNSSLRTRLSTQKAGMNLGMNTMVLDVNAGAWKLETERGVVMDGDKPEHILEAIPVMASYCDVIGV